jgi:hypothetical protein
MDKPGERGHEQRRKRAQKEEKEVERLSPSNDRRKGRFP